MSPAVRYLLQRLVELEQGMAQAADVIDRQKATIAELEKNQRKPRAARPAPAAPPDGRGTA